jgi:hypothetical protein
MLWLNAEHRHKSLHELCCWRRGRSVTRPDTGAVFLNKVGRPHADTRQRLAAHCIRAPHSIRKAGIEDSETTTGATTCCVAPQRGGHFWARRQIAGWSRMRRYRDRLIRAARPRRNHDGTAGAEQRTTGSEVGISIEGSIPFVRPSKINGLASSARSAHLYQENTAAPCTSPLVTAETVSYVEPPGAVIATVIDPRLLLRMHCALVASS